MTSLFGERECVLFCFCPNSKGTELVLMCLPVTESVMTMHKTQAALKYGRHGVCI
jgi:hypothetical protein